MNELWVKLEGDPLWHLELAPDSDAHMRGDVLTLLCGRSGELAAASTRTERRSQCALCRARIGRRLADPRSGPLIARFREFGNDDLARAFIEGDRERESRAIDQWLVWCLSSVHGPLSPWRDLFWCKAAAELYRRRASGDAPALSEWIEAQDAVNDANRGEGRTDHTRYSKRRHSRTVAAARIVSVLCDQEMPKITMTAWAFLGMARPGYSRHRLVDRLIRELERRPNGKGEK